MRRRVTVYLDERIDRMVRQKARQYHGSVSTVVNNALRLSFDRYVRDFSMERNRKRTFFGPIRNFIEDLRRDGLG